MNILEIYKYITYNKAITRQITEAVKIDTTSKPLMNTKIVFNTNNIIHIATPIL